MAVSLTSTEVRDCILRFLDGDKIEPWEWDDFVSVPVKDPFLNSVRLLCLHISDAFPPPPGSKSYCSDQGAELMREIAGRLP